MKHMNVGNHVKIVSISELLHAEIAPGNCEDLLNRISLHVDLLRHGLRFEESFSNRIQIVQAIALLEGKQKEIKTLLLD